MKRVSIKDIARMVGVSPSTVSFVLNGKASQMRISEAVAARIQSVAAKAGYTPNQVAVSLRTGQSKIIGLIVESISGNFFGALARIIEDEADKLGYKVVYCSTENEGQKGKELIRMLAQRQVDGYLITPTSGMEKDIQALAAQKKPLVLMDSYFPGIDTPHVLVDNFGGVARGMKHLFSKGYKKIGFVTVDLDLVQVKERKNAYTALLKEKGIPVSKKLLLTLPYEHSKEEGLQQISAFIKNARPDAVFFATNYLGVLGLEAIRDLGLRIPDDLAVICFDDHDIFHLYPPGITSIRQPVEEIAQTAVHLLMGQLGKKKISRKNKVQLAAKLVVRGST